jgi:hypothetical protein
MRYQIRNCTGHKVTVTDGKYKGEYLPSGTILRAREVRTNSKIAFCGIHVFIGTPPKEDELLIVSKLTGVSGKGRYSDRLLIPYGVTSNARGETVCRELLQIYSMEEFD